MPVPKTKKVPQKQGQSLPPLKTWDPVETMRRVFDRMETDLTKTAI